MLAPALGQKSADGQSRLPCPDDDRLDTLGHLPCGIPALNGCRLGFGLVDHGLGDRQDLIRW
jgi:hypothetical protein